MARRSSRATRRIAQPGGGRWVVRTNPVEGHRAEITAGLPRDLAQLLAGVRATGARVSLRRTEVAEGAFRGDPGQGRYVPAFDVRVELPRRGAARERLSGLVPVLRGAGFQTLDNEDTWLRYVRPARRNPSPARRRGGVAARTPPLHITMRSRGGGDVRQLAALARAHGFRRDGRAWSLDLPALEVEARTNPAAGGEVVTPYDLRPGDTIVLEDLGRTHVIEGPFRSGRGIRFVNEYGTSLILAPNERVRRVGRANPSVEVGTSVGALQQRVASILDGAGLLAPGTRFRETSRGGLQVTRVDSHAIGQNERLEDRLARAASVAGFDFEIGGESLLMLPFGVRHREGYRRFYANPPVRYGTPVASMQQEVAATLHRARVMDPRVRFRETSRGGLQVRGVPMADLASRPWLVERLHRLAAARGFVYELSGDGFLMLPWAARAARPAAVANPGRAARAPRRRAARSASVRAIPASQIEFVVDRLHVGTPDAAVEADIRRRTAGWPPALAEQAVCYAIERHHHNQEDYRGVMRGRFNNPRSRRGRR